MILPVRLAYNSYIPVGGVDTNLSPIIFLHGMGSSKENWDGIAQNVANATRRKAYAIDARNHGDSEWSDEISAQLMVTDLLHFMEQEKINKVILVGHSMGGKVSLIFGLHHDKVEQLIVEEMLLNLPAEKTTAMKAFFYFARKGLEAAPADLDEEATRKFIVDYIYMPVGKTSRESVTSSELEEMLHVRKGKNGRYEFKTNIDVLEKSITCYRDQDEMKGKFEGPVCFIYGKQSPFEIYTEASLARQYFPNVVYKGVEKAGHAAHKDNPAEFTDIVVKFINSPTGPVHIAYKLFTAASGENESLFPILFLHGFGTSKNNWGYIPQHVANATGRKVYALDARSHGDSEWSDDFNSDANMIDLLHFMESEKIDKAILVGHSMSGIAAMKAALKQPNKVEKLVVEDIHTRYVPAELVKSVTTFFHLARRALRAAPPDLDEKATRKFVAEYICSKLPTSRTAIEDLEELIELKKGETGHYTLKANADVLLEALASSDTRDPKIVGTWEGPTCFIYGKLSPYKVYNEMDHIRRHFPNAVFKGIDGATHTVHSDRPIEFTAALLKFICDEISFQQAQDQEKPRFKSSL